MERQTARESTATRRGASYFVQHWRGELPLPVSYWFNNALLSIGVMALLLGAPWREFVERSPRLYSGAIVAVWLLLLVLTVWQIVGTWRAADAYAACGKRKLWASAAKIGLIISFVASTKEFVLTGVPQVTEYAKLAAGRDPLGAYQVRLIRGATELEVAGSIVFGLADDVSRALEAHPNIRVIHLNSHGGRVSEARRLRNVIQAAKLTTYTASGCFSACTLAYAAGTRRLIATDAALGFHQYAFPGVKPGDLNAVYEIDKSDWLGRGFARDFVERAFTTPSTDLWKPTHRELVEAHIITGYPRTDEVAQSPIGAISAAYQPSGADELLQLPLFQSLKVHEPRAYEQLFLRMQAELPHARDHAQLKAIMLPLVQDVVTRKLPYASDQALLGFVDLAMRQMAELRAVDPALCYDYLFPARSGARISEAASRLSSDLMQKEMAVMADVVTSASLEQRQPPAASQVQDAITYVYSELSKQHGQAAVRKLANPQAAQDSKDEVCRLTYDLYAIVRQLPQREGTGLLRYMFANGR